MKQKTIIQSLFLLVALLVGNVGNAWGAEVTYKLTIDASSFNTTSYAANNNEKTTNAVCTTDAKKTYEVKWTSNQVMKSGDNMQWQKNNGYIYNSTDLGTITSVTVTKTAGTFTTYYGTSAQPSSGTAGSGKGYFKTSVGGATGTTSKVEITFVINEAPSATLESIRVKTAPKTKYKVGETPDFTGLVLEAVYDNEETMEVTSGYTASPNASTPLTTDVTSIRFTWNEKTVDMPITVGTLSSLTYNDGTFANTTYTEKDFFDPTGLVVTAHYSNSDGLEEVIDDYTLTPSTETALSTTNDKVVVSYTWAETEQTVNIPITVNAGTKYTVTYNGGAGTPAKSSDTETEYKGGVTLPSATTGVEGWEFAGWAADAVDNTTTQPTLYKAGSTYYPTIDTELHAVYTLSETGYAYTRVTSLNQINASKKIAVTSQYGSKILNNDASVVNAPTETNNEITVASDQMFVLSGDNTTGYVLTGASGTLSQEELSTSGDNDKPIDWSGTNNKWIIELNTYADNLFALRNAASDKAALEQYNGWKTEYHNDYSSRQYTAMKLYIPKTAYNSNPSAIITPTVAFDSADPVTLYLDGTTKKTNTATVTGVSKTINYTSSNTGVATVNSEGVVTAVGIGTTTITASVDAELGVSAPAYNTYEVTVKSATTLAGIKAQATSSTAVEFTADLASDLVITYVSGAHAYLQSGDVAVYASCATGDWEAGKKFTGAITGQIKRLNNEYQITSIDQTPVAGGIVPDAIEVAITDLTTANYATYEGRKIAINEATVNTKMTSSETSGGRITTDGTNLLNIYARKKGITLTKDEKGNFVGYIGRYNDGIRYYMYEQSQFTKTHNVPQNQNMSFTNSSYNLDEETDAVTNFAGQAVTATTVKGTLTYSVKDGSDDIVTSLDSSTGAVVLNGDCGTATIVATAAYYEELDGETGYYTPYPALSKEYSVTVRPRYSVTFSINGNTDEVRRQESYGAAITVPEVAAVGDYVFRGWSDTEVATTDVAPTMTTSSSITPTSTKTVYAVFAIQTQTGTTDVEDQSYSYSANTLTPGGDYSDNNSYYLLHEGGYVESEAFDLSIISKVVVYGGTYGGSGYNSLTIGDGTNTWKEVTVSGSSNTGVNTYTDGTTLSGTGKLRITSTCGGTTNGVRVSGFKIYKLGPVYSYTNYTTALSASVTIGKSHYLSYCFMNKLDFSESDVKAYKASVDGKGKVTLTKVDVVPAGEGVVLYCETPDTYSIPVTTKEASDVTGNEMVGVLVRTQVEWNPEANVYNYILQQGEFRKATTPGGYLKPNRAYLSTSYDVTTSGAKALSVVFAEEETDGIRSVGNTTEDGVRYNLSGQKVGKEYKGIVIINGKKVIRK